MKGLMKTFSGGSAMWRGWRGIGLPKESTKECVFVIVQWVGHGRWIGTVKECLKKRGLDIRQAWSIV